MSAIKFQISSFSYKNSAFSDPLNIWDAEEPTVDIEGIVVEAAVPDESPPLSPPGRDVVAPVLVQVLPKVPRPVAAVLQQKSHPSSTFCKNSSKLIGRGSARVGTVPYFQFDAVLIFSDSEI